MRTKRGARLLVTAALAAALVLPGSAIAAEDGGGGGGGHPTDNTGSLYSDLVVAYRAADGSPILKEYFAEATEEAEATSYFCVQPASFERAPGVTPVEDPLTGEPVYVLPLQGEWLSNPPETLPVEEIEPCDVQPAYAMFVSEAELERLNLGRTADDVLQRKLDDVEEKFDLGDELSLDPAGRIAVDGTVLDASPEYAAMYSSLMRTGTIPGLKEPGLVSQAAYGLPGFSYDAYELAAVALGTAASKAVPITVDTVQYYNRVVGFPADDPAPTWGITFLQSADPDGGTTDATLPRDVLPGSEKFVDYSAFTYNRAATFPGSVTWLDVPTLTWKVSRIADVVDFTEVAPGEWSGGALTGLAGFTQMADDVRAVISYLHENEVIPGFYMDPVGVDTTDEQNLRLTSPATDLVVPDGSVFEEKPFDVSASVFNPALGTDIDHARLRVTITPEAGDDPLSVDDLGMTAADGQAVTFTAEGDSLVGWWGPDTGFDVPKLSTQTTEFTATLADGTAGTYQVALELVDLDTPGTALATDQESLSVLDNVPTVLWAGEVPTVSTQGSQIPLPLNVYAPADGAAELRLTVSVDDPTTDVTPDPLVAGNVRVYGEQGDAMVAMPMTAGLDGVLTGTWDMGLVAGDNPVTWFFSVVEGAPVGQYTLDATLVDGTDAADAVTIGISAPVDHKSPRAPVIETPEVSGDSVTLVASSSDKDVDHYRFVLVKDFVHLRDVTTTDGTVTFEDLDAGTYKVNVTAVDKAGNVSDQATTTFVIEETTVQAPDTFIARGPLSGSFVLGRSVTYRLGSDGDGVQYRVTLNDQFNQSCDTNVCVVDGLKSGKNVIEFAAEADGVRDDTPAVRRVYVPRGAAALKMTDRWTIRQDVDAFDGSLARTRKQGQVIRTSAGGIKRIALVVAKGADNGKVRVYLGDRLLTSKAIRLTSPTNRHQVLIPVTTFRKLQTGVVRVKVVSHGKPVRIEGIGIVNR
jgi:hypothetical protein